VSAELSQAVKRAEAAEVLVVELREALNLCAFPNLVGGESGQLLHAVQSRQAIARAALAKTPADMICVAREKGSRVYCQCPTCRGFQRLSQERADMGAELARLREALNAHLEWLETAAEREAKKAVAKKQEGELVAAAFADGVATGLRLAASEFAGMGETFAEAMHPDNTPADDAIIS
jgi:hypothetical protein